MASVGIPVATAVLMLASSAHSARLVRSRANRSRVDPLPGMVITLGDSYVSGCGIHRYGFDYDEEFGGYVNFGGQNYALTEAADGECWREFDTTPGARYANLSSVNKESRMYACKGAEIPQIRRQFEYINAVHSDYSSQRWPQSVIMMSAGGNDIKNDDGDSWSDILVRCITNSPFRNCQDYPENIPTSWGDVADALFELYTFVGSGAAEAKIRIFGYPEVFLPVSGCATVIGVSTAEANWADEQIARFNSVSSSAVSRAVAYLRDTANLDVDMRFVDVASYIRFGACDTTENREINDVELSWLSAVSDQSFHPTQRGYDAYYRALVDSL